MVTVPKGGRGHKAPYETTTVRIPVAIRDEVEEMSNRYRQSAIEGKEFTSHVTNCDINGALAIAKKILKQRRSLKLSIIKLLQVLYNVKLSEKDLE